MQDFTGDSPRHKTPPTPPILLWSVEQGPDRFVPIAAVLAALCTILIVFFGRW